MVTRESWCWLSRSARERPATTPGRSDACRSSSSTVNYSFVSEFVHPSVGSFSIYQEGARDEVTFDRALGLRFDSIQTLLSALRMTAHFLLKEAGALGDLPDLSPNWPGLS